MAVPTQDAVIRIGVYTVAAPGNRHFIRNHTPTLMTTLLQNSSHGGSGSGTQRNTLKLP